MSAFEVEVCFYIYSVRLCLFRSKLRPLILREINDQQLLVSVIFGFVVADYSVCFPSLSFAVHGLSIACVYVSVASFLGLEFSF